MNSQKAKENRGHWSIRTALKPVTSVENMSIYDHIASRSYWSGTKIKALFLQTFQLQQDGYNK